MLFATNIHSCKCAACIFGVALKILHCPTLQWSLDSGELTAGSGYFVENLQDDERA